MTQTQTINPASDSSPRERIEALLQKYPDISDSESEEIFHFLRSAPHLEVGLLTAREGVRANLDAFRRRYRKKLGLSLKDYVTFLLVTALPLALFCWLVMR